MNILFLRMSAFASFAGETEIDFTRLGRDGIFLVTGDTGAGKTTIFDAISFALYGEASGGAKRRQARGFRSDFAAPDTDTYVSLTFEARSKRWTVKRSPEYLRPKKRGEGMVKEGATAELRCLTTGEEWSGTKEVAERISEILVLTREQFSQTVMIAQGDFLKILQSGSAERKELLQQLFSTSVFSAVQRVLKQRNDECAAERALLSRCQREAAERLAPIEDYPDKDLLAEGLSQNDTARVLKEGGRMTAWEKNVLHESENALSALDEKRIGLVKRIAEGRALNDTFQKLDAARKQEAALRAANDDVERSRAACALAKRALAVLPFERELESAAQMNQKTVEEGKAARLAFDRAEAALPKAEKEARKAAKAAEGADVMITDATRLEDVLPMLKLHREAGKEKELREKELACAVLRCNEEAELCQMARNLFYRGQSAMLAETLREGQPCPVCGSPHHPCPAEKTAEHIGRDDMEKAEKRRDEAERLVREAEMLYRRAMEKQSEAEEKLKEQNVPVSARAEDILSLARGKRREAESLRAAAQKAVDGLTKCREEARSAGERREKAGLRYREEQALIEKKREALMSELDNQGFAALKDYRAAMKPAEKVLQMEQIIRKFDEDAAAVKRAIESLSVETAGKMPCDVGRFEGESERAAEEIEALRRRKERLYAVYEGHFKALQAIEETVRRKEKMQGRWTVVNDLYTLVAGQAEQKVKLSFETYVQQYYFKRVTAAANKRLMLMTEGAFLLRVKEEARDMRSQAGLELDVFDRSTGKWRDVSTLSGGESFMASLALALGLSDVVQEESGAVRLNTMFIDEGFGTLDENALKKAMELLSDLADGKRQVGIISHVRELKERIDRQIVVKKTPAGSVLRIQGVE